MTVFIKPFDDKTQLLSLLEKVGLAKGEYVKTEIVDIFAVWPKKYGSLNTPTGPTGEQWYDDVEQEPKWAANLALKECPKELLEYQIFPETPRRVFSE
jgi:hypothetical protein